jgi:hypothetical protein
MSAPSTLTVSYISAYTSGGDPSATSTATVPIPTVGVGQPIDYTQAVRNIFITGGLWIVSAGIQSFIPWGEIFSITAQ